MQNANQQFAQSEAEEKRKLYNEFRAIDVDGNGYVDKNEMLVFLAQKGIDEDHRGQIVDELFSKCDQNNDGDVQIEEFVNYYIITKNELIKRKQELTAQILENNAVLTQLNAQLVNSRTKATQFQQ